MTTVDLAAMKQTLAKHNVLLSFSGPITHGIIEDLGKAVRHYLESEAAPASAVMDVFAVYVELTQNIRNYCLRKLGDPPAAPHPLQEGILVIGRNGESYLVSSGNLVAHEDLDALTRRIDHLRDLDRAQLRALYKEQLRKERVPGQEGQAGLGLIDMARKASHPLEYAVSEVDGQYAFFSLRVIIRGGA